MTIFSVSASALNSLIASMKSRPCQGGPLEKPTLKSIADLSAREVAILAPLVILVIYYGILPGSILDGFAASTDALVKGYQAALSATQTAALP